MQARMSYNWHELSRLRKYTSKRPKLSGYYWYKESSAQSGKIVEVFEYITRNRGTVRKVLLVNLQLSSNKVLHIASEAVRSVKGFWAGPICEPDFGE